MVMMCLSVQTHDGPVTGISLHATGDYLLSSSVDQASRSICNARILNLALFIFLPHAELGILGYPVRASDQ